MRGEKCGGILCRAESFADLGFAPDQQYVPCFCLQIHEGGELDERNVNLVYIQGSFDICRSIHIE